MERLIKYLRRNNKGFTLMELVVAVGIMILIAAIATPLLLSHIEDAKVANVNENVLNIRTALNSYISSHGGIQDTDGDGDYLDELVEGGYISENVNIPACSKWSIVKVTDDEGNEAFVLQVDYDNCSAESQKQTSSVFKKLDQNVDDGDKANGFIRIITD